MAGHTSKPGHHRVSDAVLSSWLPRRQGLVPRYDLASGLNGFIVGGQRASQLWAPRRSSNQAQAQFRAMSRPPADPPIIDLIPHCRPGSCPQADPLL